MEGSIPPRIPKGRGTSRGRCSRRGSTRLGGICSSPSVWPDRVVGWVGNRGSAVALPLHAETCDDLRHTASAGVFVWLRNEALRRRSPATFGGDLNRAWSGG